VVVGGAVGYADGVLVMSAVYVMQEHAEETAFTSGPQLLKSVGIADGAVTVEAKKPGQKATASAWNRTSTISL